jgi:hypothetical protein
MALTPQLRSWNIVCRLWATGNGRVPVQESETIKIDGVLLGIVVSHQLGVRFIAGNDRVRDMDQSVWPTQEYARRVARQLFRSNTPRTFSAIAWTASGLSPNRIRKFSPGTSMAVDAGLER